MFLIHKIISNIQDYCKTQQRHVALANSSLPIMQVYPTNLTTAKDQSTPCNGAPQNGMAWSIFGQLTAIKIGIF
jgi:hypothetical protein